MFLNKEKIPFEDLPAHKMKLIVRNRRHVEWYAEINEEWLPCDVRHSFQAHTVYRMAPRPDEIDWSAINPIYRHMRKLPNKYIRFFENEPILINDLWSSTGEQAFADPSLLASYRDNGIPWDQMICDRPED